jgi:hypothetical protein
MSRFTLLVVGLVISVGGPLARAGESPRGLSDAELGHLRQFVRLASQDLDDWRGWEGADQRGMEAYRYQAAFMAYTLTLQQYHSVPAYRELHEKTIARLIVRMLQKPVWEYWEEVSQGLEWYDPDFSGPLPAVRDPVQDRNIMYSGHLVHMAALHEMLYRDFRWDLPGAFTFRWSESEAYAYSLPTLITRIRDEMADGPGGVQCEPNLIFPECNQHPILAFKLFDDLHSTDLFAARTYFARLFTRAPMVDPETHEVVAYYRVKQDEVLGDLNPRVGMPTDLVVWPLTKLGLMSFDSPSACGWTGVFMHAWDPESVSRHYPHQRAHHVLLQEGGGVRPSFDMTDQLSVGYFASLAVEMGDEATARKLLAYADATYEPVWEDGRLVYPIRAREPEGWLGRLSSWLLWDRGTLTTHLTDKLIALARSNRPNGMWQLHNRQWTDADFRHPLVEGVDFPRALVRSAWWDADAQVLHVTLVPGTNAAEPTRFRVTGLDPAESWEVLRDGAHLARIGDWAADLPGEGVRIAAPGVLELTTSLQSEQHFELRTAGGPRAAPGANEERPESQRSRAP